MAVAPRRYRAFRLDAQLRHRLLWGRTHTTWRQALIPDLPGQTGRSVSADRELLDLRPPRGHLVEVVVAHGASRPVQPSSSRTIDMR